MEERTVVYNTEEDPLVISEYGRNVQGMVQQVMKVEDRVERTKLAEGVVDVMISLNPQIKELEDYEHKLWDHLYIISGYELDVDGPYPKPEPEKVNKPPEAVPYKDELIKFRFYGRNLQQMVERAAAMEDSEMKNALINYIASFMVNTSRNWNDENLDNKAVITHLNTLSKGQLSLSPEDLEIHIEHRARKPKPNKPYKSNNKRNKKKR